MNILYTLNSGNPGGMEQHVLDLVVGMVNKGHKVYVWCRQGQIVDWYTKAGAEVYTKKISFELDPKYIFELTKFLKQNKIDVIHSHELKASANALLAGFFARTKVKVSHIHTPMAEWRHPNLLKKLFSYLEMFGYSCEVNMFSSAEMALTPSRKLAKVKTLISPSKIQVIPNGFDIDRFDISPDQKLIYKQELMDKYNLSKDKFIFGLVSRMTFEKGHEILINAFSSFSPSKFTLFLAGGGELENLVKGQIAENSLQNNVIVTGVFEPQDLPKFYCLFDCFVLPSLAEGFCYVFLEALFSGKPVISSDLPVLKEVGGENALYFKKGDSKDLQNKMNEVVNNYDAFLNKAKKAKDFVNSTYSINRFVNKYESLYLDLLKKKV